MASNALTTPYAVYMCRSCGRPFEWRGFIEDAKSPCCGVYAYEATRARSLYDQCPCCDGTGVVERAEPRKRA